MRRLLHSVFVLVLVLVTVPAFAGPTPDVLRPSALPPPAEQAALLWARSPKLQATRAQLEQASAEVERAHLLPNPALDLSWNTIPIGETNPPGLAHPLAEVPNYAAGLSTLVELGKRGPRQRAASSAQLAARAQAQAELVDQYLELQQHLAEIAAAQLREEGLRELADDGHRLTELQRARAQQGDIAALDVDRSVLEEQTLESSQADEHARLQAALRACGAVAGLPCAAFDDTASAAAFLRQRPPAAARLDDRPDLRALEAQEATATHQVELGRAKAIPDPTLRLGYVNDRFAISGNQTNSLFVGASLPLTLFDHGQADVHAATAQASSARTTRALLVAQASTALAQLATEQAQLATRQSRVRDQSLPLAKALVSRLEALLGRGATSLPDLILARRTLGALSLEAVDLDLGAFTLALETARLGGTALALPPELTGSVSTP